MTAQFTFPKQYLADESGEPMLGAKLNFYEIGTSTRKDTYIASDLEDPHPNPVVSDAFGVFPQIWLDESTTDYRVVVTDQFDAEIYTIDGLLDLSTPTALLESIKTVDGPGSGLDADTLDGLDSTDFAQVDIEQTITGFWDFSNNPTINDVEVGYKNIPTIPATAQHELSLNDDGHTIAITTGGIVIPVESDEPFELGPFPVGFCCCMYNDSSSNQTVTAQTPATTTIRLAATASTGTRTIAPRGLAVLYQVKLNVWLVYGAGVT